MTRLAVVLKGYPRLSETFIAQELRALERRGLALYLVSLRHPTDKLTHPAHDAVVAAVNYLPEYLHEEPGRVLAAVWRGWRRACFWAALWIFLKDLLRDRTVNRIRRFGQAVVLADELPDDISHIHAHFLHTPTSVARYAAILAGLSFSVSAHAKDIWTSPTWELREKLEHCRFAVTCTAHNLAYLRALAVDPKRVSLIYHGLDLEAFSSPPKRIVENVGSVQELPVRLLSVGRMVEKKGYDLLIEALSRLPAHLSWRLDHIGGGPLARELRARVQALGLQERVFFHGARAQAYVLAQYRLADVFVLASRIADDGDRDGLPNVLMEAQSQRIACVSTRVSAIPELIEDQLSGLLVPPDDAVALSDALQRLIVDPLLRERLANTGERRVREHFNLLENVTALARALEEAVGKRRLEPANEKVFERSA